MAKYLDTSLASEKVVSAPRDELLFADFHHGEQLGRIGVEIDHVAGLLGHLCARVHCQAHVGLGQQPGASLVPSPTIATRRPPLCSARMRASLSSGRASAM